MREFAVRNVYSGEVVIICGYNLLDALERSLLDPSCWELVGST